MRCFTHPRSEAVGICSSCNKGVCARCAVERDGKVHCKACIAKSKFSELKCANHPRSEAVGICSACKKPICDACAIDKEGKLYCRLCSAELPSEFEVPEPARIAEARPAYEEERLPPPRIEERRIPRMKVELAVKTSETVSSTIFGGIVGGFLMGLPFINLLLIWEVVGGYVAAYLLRLRVDRYGNGYLRSKDAMFAGAISGVFAAFLATFFNIVYAVLFKGMLLQAGDFLLSLGLDVGIVDIIMKASVTDLTLPAAFIFTKLVVTVALFALLGAVGGAISSELSRK